MKTETVESLQAKLARVNEALQMLDQECERTSGQVTNPVNDIGGIRSRSRRQKDRLFDRWDRQARDYGKLTSERRRLEAQIKYLQAQPARQAADDAVTEYMRTHVKVGDKVWVNPFPDPVTVVRVNQKSVTIRTDSGYQETASFRQICPTDRAKAVREIEGTPCERN